MQRGSNFITYLHRQWKRQHVARKEDTTVLKYNNCKPHKYMLCIQDTQHLHFLEVFICLSALDRKVLTAYVN